MKLHDLLQYEKIVIQCHNGPDPDALASAYAIWWYLGRHGKTARIIYGSKDGEHTLIQKSNMLYMLQDLGLEDVVEHVSELNEIPDLLLCVDCRLGGSNARLYGPQKKERVPGYKVNFNSEEDVLDLFGARAVAVIDHHSVKDPPPLPPMQVIKAAYGSCSTILWEMLEDEKKLDPALEQADEKEQKLLATALYYGLYTDTSELQELSHPKDIDMMEKLNGERREENMLFHWQTSNLSLSEMKMAGQALSQYDYYEEGRFAIMEMKSEDGCWPDQNLLGIIADLLIRVDKIDTCVAFCEQATSFRLSVRTCSPEALATDIIKFLTNGIGGGNGHQRKTGGSLNKKDLWDVFKAWYGFEPETPAAAARQLLTDRMRTYYNSFVIFYSKREETTRQIGLDTMQTYEKRTDGNPIGYIHLAGEGLYEPGTVLTIRTLQGDMKETVMEDTYLMFGVGGELYTNSEKDFLAQYEPCEEIYRYPKKYPPHIPSVNGSEEEKLDAEAFLAHVHACRPKPGHRVFARQLKRWAKVFSPRRPDYILGQPQDWLVAKSDNPSHIHIVKAESFPKLYTLVEKN